MVELKPLHPSDREQFILDNQEAFNYGALEEFGRRDDHFEEDDQIISRETIEASIDGGEAYRIFQDGQPIGGVVIKVEAKRGDLELLFVSPRVHSKGIGYSLDGERFDMVRLFSLPVGESVKVGLEAQSPAGEGGLRLFSDVTLERRTVQNLRAGA